MFVSLFEYVSYSKNSEFSLNITKGKVKLNYSRQDELFNPGYLSAEPRTKHRSKHKV